MSDAQPSFASDTNREGHDFSRADKEANSTAALAAEENGFERVRLQAAPPELQRDQAALAPDTPLGRAALQRCDSFRRRMLAVTQFFEDDDMAFVLDRMLSRPNPMRSRLTSGRYFVRFVVIEDSAQRRSICAALNQWMVSAAEKATGIGSHFASSLELTPATEYVARATDSQADFLGRTLLSPAADTIANRKVPTDPRATSAAKIAAPHLDSGAAANIHCPSPFPSGF